MIHPTIPECCSAYVMLVATKQGVQTHYVLEGTSGEVFSEQGQRIGAVSHETIDDLVKHIRTLREEVAHLPVEFNKVPRDGYVGYIRIIAKETSPQFFAGEMRQFHEKTTDINWDEVRGVTVIAPDGSVRLYMPLPIKDEVERWQVS